MIEISVNVLQAWNIFGGQNGPIYCKKPEKLASIFRVGV